jgi:hypothetical protein
MQRNARPTRRGALLIRGQESGILIGPALRSSASALHRVRDMASHLASAYFSASLGRRFPNNIVSLIRSFARHPALLTRNNDDYPTGGI